MYLCIGQDFIQGCLCCPNFRFASGHLVNRKKLFNKTMKFSLMLQMYWVFQCSWRNESEELGRTRKFVEIWAVPSSSKLLINISQCLNVFNFLYNTFYEDHIFSLGLKMWLFASQKLQLFSHALTSCKPIKQPSKDCVTS